MPNNVRKLRLERKLTQEALAQLTGIQRPNLVAVETGRRDLMESRLRTVVSIAKALGVPIEKLLEKET